ncbi:MAG: LytR C-terminal domain-containing protein [Candidatus Levyibacteriota bacterium]
MPKKARKVKKNNLKVGIIFSVLIVTLILLSVFGKIVNVLQQGKYDSNYPFSLRVVSGKETAFLSISPKEKEIAYLRITGAKDMQDVLPFPSEGEITASFLPSSKIPDFFRSLLGSKENETNLTVIDIARLYFTSKSVSPENVTVKNVSATEAADDKEIGSLFLDRGIVAEDKRVEVVNATGVYGVGNSVAKMLTNLGANVIFVSTADKDEKESVIYFHSEKGYTVNRLIRILGFKTLKREGESISDITVRIGQDSIESIDQ